MDKDKRNKIKLFAKKMYQTVDEDGKRPSFRNISTGISTKFNKAINFSTIAKWVKAEKWESIAVSDIFCSLTKTRLKGLYGHELKYYGNDQNDRGMAEIIANLFDLYYLKNKDWDFVKTELPELTETFEELLIDLSGNTKKWWKAIMRKEDEEIPLDIDHFNHIGEAGYLTDDLIDCLQKYHDQFLESIFVNYIKEEITAKQAIERMEKAIKDNRPIKITDATFFEQD